MMKSLLLIFLVFCVVFFDGVIVAHIFSFLCCVFCFVYLRPVSCVPNVVSISGLSVSDCPFGHLNYGSAIRSFMQLALYTII